MKRSAIPYALVFFGVYATCCMAQIHADPIRIEIPQPLRHQVYQRRFDVPQLSHSHHPGGPVKGIAYVDCILRFPPSPSHRILYRIRRTLAETQSDGGSIWPLLGDMLVNSYEVPVGFANVAVGGGPLFQRLVEAGKQIKDFRAGLWQQGESDVLEKTDTDRLDGANRGPMDSRRHFTGMGQRNAAAMRFVGFSEQIDAPKSLYLEQVARLQEMHLRKPAWKSAVVHRESSILIKDGSGPPTARLAFPADQILRIQPASGSANHPGSEYQEGVHWRLSDNRSTLEWIGPVPCEPIRTDQLFVPEGSPNSYKHRVGNPQQNLLYAPGNWFHERNIEITYRRADAIPESQDEHPPKLVRTLEKLRKGARIVLGVSGDSISTGLDASGTTMSPPNQPGYPELVSAQLTQDFGAEIHLVNRSVPGWSIANGFADLDKLLESKPDLLIVAYGMNDVGRRDPAWFADQAQRIQARARAVQPEIEIVWVTPMLGNREWVHTPRDMFFAYQESLQKVVAPGDALADVTMVWEIMLRQKHDLDLTGNGLNHPNDFGHRLYAQSILELFPE